jgi:hypothetical protein
MSVPPELPPESPDAPRLARKSTRDTRYEEESRTRLLFLGIARTFAETVMFVSALVSAIWAQLMLWALVGQLARDVLPLAGIVAVALNGVVGVLLLKRISIVSIDLDRSRITNAGLQMAALMGCAFSCLLMGMCGGLVAVG